MGVSRMVVFKLILQFFIDCKNEIKEELGNTFTGRYPTWHYAKISKHMYLHKSSGVIEFDIASFLCSKEGRRQLRAVDRLEKRINRHK